VGGNPMHAGDGSFDQIGFAFDGIASSPENGLDARDTSIIAMRPLNRHINGPKDHL